MNHVHQIVAVVSEGPKTAKEIAAAMGAPNTYLYGSSVNSARVSGYLRSTIQGKGKKATYTITEKGLALLAGPVVEDWPDAQLTAVKSRLDLTDRELVKLLATLGPTRTLSGLRKKLAELALTRSPAILAKRRAAQILANAARNADQLKGWPKVPPEDEADAVFVKALALEMQRLGMISREAA